LLSVKVAASVNSAVPSKAIEAGYLRLRTGDRPRRTSTSANQPPTTLPTTPQANGMAAAMPVLRTLMCRSISR